MTEQFRACCVCFRCWTPIDGERKCPGCLGRLVPNNTVTKRPTPTLDPVETLTRGVVENDDLDVQITNDADEQAWRSAAAKAVNTGSPQLKWPGRESQPPQVRKIPHPTAPNTGGRK